MGHGRKEESSIRASFNSLVTSYDSTHSVISLLWHLLGVLQSWVFLFCIGFTGVTMLVVLVALYWWSSCLWL